MKNDLNGIEVYEAAFEKAYCDEVIRCFEEMQKMNITTSLRSLEKNSDDRVTLDWALTRDLYHYDYDICNHFYSTINHFYTTQYQEKYDTLKKTAPHSPKCMSVQRTGPHQGYHSWHQESASIGTSARAVTYMLYLNDIEEGGETEFLYQGIRLKPKAGSLVFFPTSYTHPHRGNPIYKDFKYIITGWYTYDA